MGARNLFSVAASTVALLFCGGCSADGANVLPDADNGNAGTQTSQSQPIEIKKLKFHLANMRMYSWMTLEHDSATGETVVVRWDGEPPWAEMPNIEQTWRDETDPVKEIDRTEVSTEQYRELNEALTEAGFVATDGIRKSGKHPWGVLDGDKKVCWCAVLEDGSTVSASLYNASNAKTRASEDVLVRFFSDIEWD